MAYARLKSKNGLICGYSQINDSVIKPSVLIDDWHLLLALFVVVLLVFFFAWLTMLVNAARQERSAAAAVLGAEVMERRIVARSA